MSSSPYYRFGSQRRYAYAWSGGQGGVLPSTRSAEARELSGDPLIESGATPFSVAFPAFRHTRLHDLGSAQLARPAGYEPIVNDEALGMLSDMERKAAVAIAAAAALYLMLGRKRRRR